MSTEFKRAQRVSQLIQRELATLFIEGLKDPRVGFVTVTEVRATDDLKNARVFVSIYGSDAEREASLAGLRDAAGYLKREIGQRLRLRFTPNLSFELDTSLDHAARMESLLQAIDRGDTDAPDPSLLAPMPTDTARSDIESTRKHLDELQKPARPDKKKRRRRYS